MLYSKHGRKNNQYVCTFQSTEPPSHKVHCNEFYKRKSAVEIFLHLIQVKSRLQFCQHDYQAGVWKQIISSHWSYVSMPHILANIPNYDSYVHPLIQQECDIPGLAVQKLPKWLNGSVRVFFILSGCTSLRLLNTYQKHDARRLLAQQVLVPVSATETHFLTSHQFVPLQEELPRECCTLKWQFHK